MPSPTRLAAALLAPALLTEPAAVRAQLPNPLAPAGPRVGVMAGLSSATLGGSDVSFSASGVDKKRRNGLVAGAYLTFPLVAGLPLSIRPELLYAQKGFKVSAAGDESKLALDYLELPVLLQLTVPNTAGLRPALYAGPSVAYRVRCSAELASGGVTASTGCNDADVGLDRKVDVSGVVGAQLGFALAGQAVGVGARYTHGFTNLAKDLNLKNRAFAVYGSLEFGR